MQSKWLAYCKPSNTCLAYCLARSSRYPQDGFKLGSPICAANEKRPFAPSVACCVCRMGHNLKQHELVCVQSSPFARTTGLEPATFRVTSGYSNQLSYVLKRECDGTTCYAQALVFALTETGICLGGKLAY